MLKLVMSSLFVKNAEVSWKLADTLYQIGYGTIIYGKLQISSSSTS